MRLDWYLPFLRKQKQTETSTPPPRIVRVAKHLLPSSWWADPVNGRPGHIRRALARLGPTVVSSPVRRLVQAVCFVVFLVMIFYVSWPYTARPVPPGETWEGLQLVDLDQETGILRFEWAEPNVIAFIPGQSLYLVEMRSDAGPEQAIAPLSVVDASSTHVALEPGVDFTADKFDRVLTSQGRWALHASAPGAWPSHYADDLQRKEFLPAEMFLRIDPLVSISTALAARSWVGSLTAAAGILLVCLLIPRGFCGYLCPLGTLIDLFDWALAGRTSRLRLRAENGWWVHIKYTLLTGTLVGALFGVLVSGYVAAIPVVTRGLVFLGEPLQSGLSRGWHLVPAMNGGHLVSIVLFLLVLMLGFLRPRFWCKYVCPSGAIFSLGNLLRITQRQVEQSCIHCNKCVEICPFDAIKPDFTTRTTDCTLCQTCGGVCPTHAIKFVERWNHVSLKAENEPETGETAIGRRGFLSLTAGAAAAVTGGIAVAAVTKASADTSASNAGFVPVRPPGSLPEDAFLQLCIRCAACFKVCPNNVLQAEGFEQGLEGLWTPLVNANWAGCESSCNACGQVCPTGAIRALPLEEKRAARMGLAIVNETTCLPLANIDPCRLCIDECIAAGYDAIEVQQVHTAVDQHGNPIEGSGQRAPVIVPHKCVGCGLCQTRCYALNVKEKHLLAESAIIVAAGAGYEDRWTSGSYVERQQAEARRRQAARSEGQEGEYFIPSLDPSADPLGPDLPADMPSESDPRRPETPDASDPFGIGEE